MVDLTGIEGLFDISMDVSEFNNHQKFNLSNPGRKYDEMRNAAFVFLSGVLEKQYGLSLEHRKVELESLVVDS